MPTWTPDASMPRIDAIEASQRTFLQRVFGWMAGGLALTGAVAWTVGTNPDAFSSLFRGAGGIVLILAYIGLAIGIGAAAGRAKAGLASFLFVAFSVVTGLLLAPIFVVYAHSMVATAFFVSAGTFGACAIYGAVTKVDLTKFGSLCAMALIGAIIGTIVNWFVKSSSFDWFLTYLLVFVFMGLTAWDVQKLKAYHRNGIEGGQADRSMAIGGALMLYLDFVNLFLLILKILGKSRR
jgi:uncharacterized protein